MKGEELMAVYDCAEEDLAVANDSLTKARQDAARALHSIEDKPAEDQSMHDSVSENGDEPVSLEDIEVEQKDEVH